MKSSGIMQVDPKSDNKYCICQKKRNYRDGEEIHVKMEAETEVMELQVKECLKAPEAGRSMEGFLPDTSERA
jgi:hypothetical protein